jgi:ATP-dependent protease ClpP protease subunit
MKFYTINKTKAQAVDGVTSIYIHGEIGGYGSTSKEFVQDLNEIKSDKINLHIDSVGGSITDGTVMYNALRSHSAKVDVYIDGIAASIASIVMLAGDNIYIPDNAAVMVHLPMISYMEYANVNELNDAAELLEKYENVLTTIYERHTNQSVEAIKKWYEKDTWFFGQEAVDAGLATEVIDSVAIAAKADVIKTFSDSQYSSVNKTQNTTQSSNMETEVEEVEEVEETNEDLSVLVESVNAKEEEIVALQQQIESMKAEAEAQKEAQDELAEIEAKRKSDINALNEKFDVEGDLALITNEALSGQCSVEDFKELLLEKISERPTAKAVKQEVQSQEPSTIEGLRAKLSETNNPVEKNLLARKLRELR